MRFEENLIEESFERFLKYCVSGFNIPSEDELIYLEQFSLKEEKNDFGI